MEVLLILVWIIVSLILGLFATTLKINSPNYRHLEIRGRFIFYLASIILSLLVGLILGGS